MIQFGLLCLLFWAAAAAPSSPRIDRLKAEVARDPAAEQRFWDEIARTSATLVEPAAEPGKSLVTFLYRGKPDTRRVVALGDGTPGAPADNQLTLIPQTSVWYRTYIHRSDARFRYTLSPNDDLRPMESIPPEDRQKRMATFLPMADVSLPGAPPQPYFEKGERSKSMIESKKFGEWTVHIYRPQGAAAKLPLVVLFDGWSYVTEFSAPVAVEKLVATGKIRPVMLAMIDGAPGKRNADLTCNEEFTTRLATEFVPWLRSNYAIADEPAAVGGMSYGGLAASFAALRYPKVFGAVLSQSGSYWWKQEWIAAQTPPAGVRYYLEVGLMEVGTPGGRTSMLESNRRLRDLLKSRGVTVRYSEFNGDHSALNWRGSFADGLIALFGRTL